MVALPLQKHVIRGVRKSAAMLRAFQAVITRGTSATTGQAQGLQEFSPGGVPENQGMQAEKSCSLKAL
jgi:hypothetical protein